MSKIKKKSKKSATSRTLVKSKTQILDNSQRIATQIQNYQQAIMERYPKAQPGEVQLLFIQANRMGLDPLSNQIMLVPRKDHRASERESIAQKRTVEVYTSTIQVGIDGFLAIANEDPSFAGFEPTTFDDGKTMTQCIADKITRPSIATARIRKLLSNGNIIVSEFTVTWASRVQAGPFWEKDPFGQLAKCAQALACRRTFPRKLSKAYLPEEIQSEHPIKDVSPKPEKPVAEIEHKPDNRTLDPWKKASARFHAIAAQRGLSTEESHAWTYRAAGKLWNVNAKSLTDLSTEQVHEIADKFDAMTPQKVTEIHVWFKSITSAVAA